MPIYSSLNVPMHNNASSFSLKLKSSDPALADYKDTVVRPNNIVGFPPPLPSSPTVWQDALELCYVEDTSSVYRLLSLSSGSDVRLRNAGFPRIIADG